MLQHNASLVTYPNAVAVNAGDVVQIFVTTCNDEQQANGFIKKNKIKTKRWDCSAAIVTAWLKTAQLLSYFTFVATIFFAGFYGN